MATSGSFANGNFSGRVMSFNGINDRGMESSSLLISVAINGRGMDSSSIGVLSISRMKASEPAVAGATRGISFGAPTSMEDGNFGRNMQVGIFKDTVEGSPTQPCLRMDIPGMWRFRWVIRTGARSVSVSAKQNSTGSYRPSMIVRKNTACGVLTDMSASAAAGAGWTTIGPITFAGTGSEAVWVELRNNNIGVANSNGNLVYAPAYFDHIVTT